MTKTVRVGCVSVFLLLAAMPAAAHHSSAMFDRDKQVSLTGTVVQFAWTNPHSWIEIDVPDQNGGSAKWSVECNSPNNLARQGWRSTSFKPGDKVTIIIHRLRSGEKGGMFVSATLADGSLLGNPVNRAPAAPSAGGAPY